MSRVQLELQKDLDDAEAKAWDALARYKFMMFGYWAAIWVHQNRVGGFRRQSPFKPLVMLARDVTRSRRQGIAADHAQPLFERDAA